METRERPVLSECFQAPQPVIEYKQRNLIDIQVAAEKDGLKFYDDERTDCFAVELPPEKLFDVREPTLPTLFFDKQTGRIARTERFTQHETNNYNSRTVTSYEYDEKGRVLEQVINLQIEDKDGNIIRVVDLDDMVADYSGETAKIWRASDSRRVPMPLERYGNKYRETLERMFKDEKLLTPDFIHELAERYQVDKKVLSPADTAKLLELISSGEPIGLLDGREIDELKGKKDEKWAEKIVDNARRAIIFLQEVVRKPEILKATLARFASRKTLVGDKKAAESDRQDEKSKE